MTREESSSFRAAYERELEHKLSEALSAHGKTLLLLNKAAFETIPNLEHKVKTLTATLAEARKQVERLSATFDWKTESEPFCIAFCMLFNQIVANRLTPPSPAPAVEGELPAITRWTQAQGDFENEMWRNPDGAYVLHSDHAEQLREALGKLKSWSEAHESVRDSVLHQRFQLADYIVDNDVINAVLGIIDDEMPPAFRTPSHKESTDGTD